MFRRLRVGTVAGIGAGGAVAAAAAALIVMGHGHARTVAASAHPAAALRVVSLSPGPGAADADGGAPVRLTLSAPDPGGPLPDLQPDVPGQWRRDGATLVFTPRIGFPPQTRVTVSLRLPGGAWTASFTTGTYPVLRLQQLLGQLGYLPVTWTGRTFTWHSGYPATLTSFWRPGQPNLITTGAIMAFQSQHGMRPDGTASPAMWAALLRAAEQQQQNTAGYTYAIASETTPETLTIWHDGGEVFHSYANTGIPVAPTAAGTYPVYLRYYFQIMRGTNPGGSSYADPVYYVSYFHGGDAVHYFPRGSYGWPQSLGCVELPWSAAARAWPYLTYGSLITIR